MTNRIFNKLFSPSFAFPNEIEDLSATERLLLTNQLKNRNEMQQAQTLILVEAGQNIGKWKVNHLEF